VVLTVAALWFLIQVFPVMILVVCSLMLVATFNPMVRRLQARFGRSWAIVGVVTGLVVLFLGTLALLIPPLVYQGYSLFQHAPQYARAAQQMLATHRIHVNVEQMVGRLVGDPSSAAPELMGVLSSTVNGITAFGTVAILTIYFLIEGPQAGTSLMRLLPKKDRLGARKLVTQIGLAVGNYMRGQIITSGLAGLFALVTLLILGVPGALALAALAAIADAIPIIGLLIAILPAALMALTLSTAKAEIVVVTYLIYFQLENHLIAPRIYGKALGLRLSVVVISILVGVELMGLLGAVLALPVAAAIPSLIAYIQEYQERHSTAEPGPLP
jgi:predicted PurR-regulated permease PerM